MKYKIDKVTIENCDQVVIGAKNQISHNAASKPYNSDDCYALYGVTEVSSISKREFLSSVALLVDIFSVIGVIRELVSGALLNPYGLDWWLSIFFALCVILISLYSHESHRTIRELEKKNRSGNLIYNPASKKVYSIALKKCPVCGNKLFIKDLDDGQISIYCKFCNQIDFKISKYDMCNHLGTQSLKHRPYSDDHKEQQNK